ncbi:MAG TPA: two-component regulator propeller domain-containing protein, partial [Cyclobacteriaceae bacterium]|nr:two-component regulator propeller domain-containing protein [Cyclobacteriaceae bacterium]
MTEFIRARKYNEGGASFNIATHVAAMDTVSLCSVNRKISVKPTNHSFIISVSLKTYAFFFLVLLAFALPTVSLGQSSFEKIKFSRVDVDNGLSNSNVTCFLQDSKGFLWVGTMDGLNKYDGYDFTIYRQQPGDTTGLLGNSIASIFEDSHGMLWAATTTHGFYYYNPLKDRFVVVPELSTYGEIVDISEDRNQTLWVTGVMRGQSFVANLNRTTNKWEHHYLFRSDARVVGIVQDSQDEYWLPVSPIGLFKWNRKTNALREISDASLNKLIVKIIPDDDANLWVATRNGLSKLNTKTETFRHFKTDLKHPEKAPLINVLHAMCRDGHYLWIATENGGLSRMDIRTEIFTNFKLDKSDPSSISDNSIWSVYKDHQSRIWVGTFSKGICVYDKIKNKFGELDISLPNDVVNAIWKDQKNRLWIGTEGGLVMQQGDHVKYYTHQRDNKSTLPNDPVLTIFEDSKNRLWFGTWDGGVSRYDEQHDNFINYTHDPANAFSLSDPNVYSIKEERATHRMLVSSYFGLNILEDERLHKFGKRFDSVTWNNFLRVVFEDSHGIVWLGSYAGFTRYDLKQNTRTRYLFDALAGSGATINCINEDKEGTIWVGSNKGLHQVQNNILVKTFTTFHGLPNDNVNGILFDDHGNLWLGTYKGISKFDMQANSFTNYDINDGLVSNEFKRNSCFKSNDGQLYFGGKGVSVFYPDSIKTNPHTPSVFLTGLKIIDKTINFGAEDSVLRYPIAETREITLKPEFNFFTIEYVALNFTASNKNQFAYKLEGFDNDWVNAGSQRFATFTNLDPATYIFRVKASNNDGLWNEKGTSIIIHVLPYWWETWWFKIILVISLVSGVILVFILRTRRMRRISVELELAVNQKTKELQQTNQALRKREAEIEEQNRMLTLQGEKMIAKNIELVSSQQELSVKSDLLLQQNEQLTKAQKTIEQHNMSIA